jgi:uncharacterized protein YndB with AHSA1/START domain
MPMIVSKIEIARPPEEVFSYVTDPSRFAEWQEGVVDGCAEGGRTPIVGSKCTTTRRIGGAARAVTSTITEVSPPRSWAVRGIDGPIRATVKVTVEPLDNPLQSRLTIALDFEGHGIGRLLVPLFVRRQARSEMPANLKRLRERLESHSGDRADQPEPER